MINDVRLACRSLVRSPGYLLAAVLTFGVAMAANSAIFGAVYAVLLKPLPIQSPERLIVWWETNPSRGQGVVEVSFRNFQDWQASSRALASVAAFESSAWPLLIERQGESVKLATIGVSSSFFDTLGTRPFLGRFFRGDDDGSTPASLLVLSHRAWLSRFGADPNIVGTTVTTGDGSARIVGVAPPQLDFPRGVDAWLPVAPVLAGTSGIDGFRDIGVLFLIGRLRAGTAPDAATTELERIARDATARGAHRFGSGVKVTGFLDYQLGPVRAALWWLSGAVIVLLLIACGNVAALLLTRAIQRKREQAVRLALGAGIAALWRPWIIETALVSIVSGIAGLVIARWLIGVIVALAPDDVPRLTEMSINVPVVLFTFAIGAAATVISTLAPLLHSRPHTPARDLSEMAHSTEGRRSTRARGMLLIMQVALATVLMTAAGLILRSYVNVRQIELGFDPANVVTLEIDSQRPTPEHNEWMRELLARVGSQPEIQSAGAVHLRPLVLGAIGTDATIVLEGQPNTRQSARMNPGINYQSATPGYFAAMRIRLQQGRLFDERDHARSPAVVLVSESAARRLWPNQDPVGRRLSLPSISQGEPAVSWRTVVGVVSDVRYRGLDDVRLDLYEPAAQSGSRAAHLMVRSSRNAVAVAAAIQAEARAIEPRTMISGVTTMSAVIDRAQATWTLCVWMFGLFAIAALTLSCVGLFSTVSLDAARRSKEFALRIALGAQPRNIARHVVGAVGTQLLAGVVAGLVLSVLGTRWMTSLLFGVEPLDGPTYAGVIGLIVSAVIVGCWWPSCRATRIDPGSMLKRD
jgi:predicted permease